MNEANSSGEIGFSGKSVEVLDKAHERARAEGVAHINHHHIMCEILIVKDKQVQMVIERLKIDKDEVWKTLTMELFAKTSSFAGTEFGPLVKLCLQTSQERARVLNRHVEPVDLLYGLLKTGNRFGALFRTLGVHPRTNLEEAFKDT